MNACYIKKAEEIFPIFGVSSIDEAKEFVAEEDHRYIVETSEDVYMNIETGSVDFESGWDYENEDGDTVNAVDLDEVVKVRFDTESESWVEA